MTNATLFFQIISNLFALSYIIIDKYYDLFCGFPNSIMGKQVEVMKECTF